MYYANRDVVKPENDEHAAMCHVFVGKFETFGEAKKAILDAIAGEMHNFSEQSLKHPSQSKFYIQMMAKRSAAMLIAAMLDEDTPTSERNTFCRWHAEADGVSWDITTNKAVAF
ncbi:hypothetical protein SEA_SIXAMA_52 [Gordonia phage Sixama]|uniref:Uncharacterized protein n=1 Tax=Gordonia phage Sixama TaxID=2653271 RepID=A0A5Q2F1V4_9CAUD|nr:hypothetical protein PP302_gp052 [Gordonia phage Sixama]QGF20231.1 hypothetical protein SEA_SIXAMA_52 [Gordonia phage Sixama]